MPRRFQANELITGFEIFFLQRQRPVADKPTSALLRIERFEVAASGNYNFS